MDRLSGTEIMADLGGFTMVSLNASMSSQYSKSVLLVLPSSSTKISPIQLVQFKKNAEDNGLLFKGIYANQQKVFFFP